MLVGLAAWILFFRPPAEPLPPTPTRIAFATAVPFTPTSTQTPFEYVPPTSTPTATPTATGTETPVPSNTPEDTATHVPTNPPRPPNPRPVIPPTATDTPTPAPPTLTPTQTPVPFPYAVSGGPIADTSRGCGGGSGYYVDGNVVDAQGQGLANVRLRYVLTSSNPNPIFARTKTGIEAGVYQLYLGVQGNVVAITIVDEGNNALRETKIASAG